MRLLITKRQKYLCKSSNFSLGVIQLFLALLLAFHIPARLRNLLAELFDFHLHGFQIAFSFTDFALDVFPAGFEAFKFCLAHTELHAALLLFCGRLSETYFGVCDLAHVTTSPGVGGGPGGYAGQKSL